MSDTIERCRRFYEEKGAPMIHQKFPEYESRIAVGVCGEGSDCFGYDDGISQDHDFGIGFAMWLTDEDYQVIGPALQNAYRELIGPAAASRLDFRRGVTTIREYYKRILGVDMNPLRPGMTASQWFTIDESKLACAVNGQVFRDDLGLFTRVRTELNYYYPDRIWRMRLVNGLHDFSQYGQANYGRCMGRGDAVAAELCRSKGIEAAMALAFLVNKVYAPYYKWTYRALRDLPGCEKLADILEKLALTPSQQGAWTNYTYDSTRTNPSDEIERLFEAAARELMEMLYSAGLIAEKVTFLEYHCGYVSAHMDQPIIPRN